MDAVTEIKARLPIEELVGQYCQLHKKGKTLKCICPFHNDTHPSMTISPDKGIAYCFACSSGGDVFSFYQKIEGVDFRQALKDLAEKTGVKIDDMPQASTNKDEKDRLRECMTAAVSFYKKNLGSSSAAASYLEKRGIPEDQVRRFEMGYAPDSFSETYEYLLKQGFSKSEILAAGLGVQKDLDQGKIYDRFRNRLMFPIHDAQGRPVAFGGRTLGDDDAKYINSSEGPLYRKSAILYGFHHAKEALREQGTVIMVEGYFDVLACHRVGIHNVVAVSGTALTEEHVRLIKRSCDSVILCLDQDRAGKEAAERSFHLCSAEGILVRSVILEEKDPDEAAAKDAEAFKKKLSDSVPYLDTVLAELGKSDLSKAEMKREALKRIVPLLNSLPSAVEKDHYMGMAAGLLGTTKMALSEDVSRFGASNAPINREPAPPTDSTAEKKGYSKVDIALGLLFMYPTHASLIDKLIEPEAEFAKAVFHAIKSYEGEAPLAPELLNLDDTTKEKIAILLLFCEHHGMSEWSDSNAEREICKNIAYANRYILELKQRQIAKDLLEARREGRRAEEEQLNTKYQQVLKLVKMASH